MMKITQRFQRAALTGEFFAINEWFFHGNNMRELTKAIKESNDSGCFNVDIGTLDWDTYVHRYMLGIRKYILKDGPDTLSKARNRLLK